MVLKIKSIPSFERGDQLEFKTMVKNEFWLNESAKKGTKPKYIAENDLKWPLGDLWGKSWPLITKISIPLHSLSSAKHKTLYSLLFYTFYWSFSNQSDISTLDRYLWYCWSHQRYEHITWITSYPTSLVAVHYLWLKENY